MDTSPQQRRLEQRFFAHSFVGPPQTEEEPWVGGAPPVEDEPEEEDDEPIHLTRLVRASSARLWVTKLLLLAAPLLLLGGVQALRTRPAPVAEPSGPQVQEQRAAEPPDPEPALPRLRREPDLRPEPRGRAVKHRPAKAKKKAVALKPRPKRNPRRS